MTNSDNNNSLKHRIEASYKNLERVIGFVSVADNKAKFILSIELIILGFLMSQAKIIFRISVLLWKSGEYLTICGSIGFLLVFAFYIFFASISIVNLINVILPKRKVKTRKKSLFYFQTIAEMEPDEFKNKIKNISEEEIIEELSDQTFNNAVIVAKKFDEIQASIKWLLGSLVLWLLLLIITAIFNGILGGC